MSENGVGGYGRRYWPARDLGKGVSIDQLVHAFVGGDTAYADKQLVVTRAPGPAGLRFSGEIDATNRDAVAKCLGLMPAAGDIHLDVSSLIFRDISGIRAFVDAAEVRAQGRLMLHGLPDRLQTVMRVTGWADLPSLVVCDRGAGLP